MTVSNEFSALINWTGMLVQKYNTTCKDTVYLATCILQGKISGQFTFRKSDIKFIKGAEEDVIFLECKEDFS